MRSLRYALVIVGLAVLCAEAPAEPGASWLLTYAGKSTNELIWDHRAASLIHASLPAALAGNVEAALGGPPDPVIVSGQRYVSMSACLPHACGEKGFLWVDTQTGTALGADADCSYARKGTARPCAVMLGSMSLSHEGIPAEAVQALRAWMADQNILPVSVEFMDPVGRPSKLDAASYAPRERFHPPADGPSFDCTRASAPIETDICTDAGLARLDLELAQLYERIRHGHATLPARQELRDLQQQWLGHRDSRCLAAADRKACLTEEYQRQRETLENWLPGRPLR
jgi:uncharacterized protein YecT (DUF1311 family)